jgi:hypothetical protein
MVAQSYIDFGQSAWSTAAICGGTYLETNITLALNHYMRWMGTGRNRVIIGTTSSVTTDTVDRRLSQCARRVGNTVHLVGTTTHVWASAIA